MRLTLARLFVLSTVLVIVFTIPVRGQDGSALVVVDQAAVYPDNDMSSKPNAQLTAGTDLTVDAACELSQPRCPMYVGGNPIRIRGWINRRDIYISEGIPALDYGRASLAPLERESGSAQNPLVWSWLRIRLGVAQGQWPSFKPAQAAQTLLDVATRRPTTMFTPWAYVLAAMMQARQGEFATELKTYDGLLAAFPSFRNEWRECIEVAVMSYVTCGGEPSFPARIAAIDAYLRVRTASTRVIDDQRATALQKARAWYALGHAREAKDKADPGPTERTGTYSDEASHAYEVAVKLAPGSGPAGDAAWRLIEFSRPYEFEGGGLEEWVLEGYGEFAKTYPRHPSAGKALFEAAMATWSLAGYPEVMGASNQSWEYLAQWFDTGGFGIRDPDEAPPEPHPNDARKALKMFQDVAVKYPTSESAPMARYFAAVIFDYCLHDRKAALAAFDAYLKRVPKPDKFTDKARKRIEALRQEH